MTFTMSSGLSRQTFRTLSYDDSSFESYLRVDGRDEFNEIDGLEFLASSFDEIDSLEIVRFTMASSFNGLDVLELLASMNSMN